MELIPFNLIQGQDIDLLKTSDSKLGVLGDAAAGIAHLHRTEIVHRDIKPEYVLVWVEDGEIVGRAKVCDFGISRHAERTKTETTQIRELRERICVCQQNHILERLSTMVDAF